MDFETPLIETRLLRRYKRFLADVETDDGSIITVHCPNPGAMLGLDQPGSRAWISDSMNPMRKLRHTLELVEADGEMVGIHTGRTNRLAREAIENGLVDLLPPGAKIRAEQRYGQNSRIDFLLEAIDGSKTFVEVKNVHLVRDPGLYEFPDSVTARGAKHLADLAAEVHNGHRAIMLYVIQRMDGDQFSIARDIDPGYQAAFRTALDKGVEALAIKCHVTTKGIKPVQRVDILG